MKVEIKPSHLRGKINAPPSKSMAHRLLICAGLAGGESVIEGVSDSEDMLATLDLLQGLGAKCEKDGQTVRVTGTDVRHAIATEALNCRECGSTLRFFIPICLLSNTPVTLCGSPRLFARPLGIYEELCRSHGLFWEQNENSVTLNGPLEGGVFITVKPRSISALSHFSLMRQSTIAIAIAKFLNLLGYEKNSAV